MTEATLKTLLEGITPPDEAARAAAHAHWASLAKPLGGLGALETTLESAAALTGSAALDLSKRAVLVLCADNGVVARGVSQTDQSVTRAVAENLAARRTSVCQMARTARCEVVPVDMGMAGEPVPGVRNCRVASGTTDFTQGPAMRREQAVEAVAKGIALVREQKAQGVTLLATGEMGIGNTTTSSAVLAVLLGADVDKVTGRGGGITEESFRKKKAVIRTAIAVNRPNRGDVIDVLAKVGGFDLAAMCGAFLGAAASRRAAVIDGFISAVAALCAVRLCPLVHGYLIPSHASFEIGYRLAIEELALRPLFDLGMRLGELCMDEDFYPAIFAQLAALAQTLYEKTDAAADAIDLGGGFGVSYRPGFSGPEPDACAKAILTQIQALPEALRGLSLQMSPGRFLAAACGTLVTRVRAVKPGPAPLAVLDVDPAQCPRLVKSGAYHPVYVPYAAGRRTLVQLLTVGTQDGPVMRRLLPELRPGDLVLIGMLGADGRSFSCASERCPAYLLRADGTIEPIE